MTAIQQMEEFVVGYLLVYSDSKNAEEKKNCLNLFLHMKTKFFQEEKCRLVFTGMKELYHAKTPISIITITHQCKKNNSLSVIGGAVYIIDLTSKIGMAHQVHFNTVCGIIIENYTRVSMRKLATVAHKKAQDSSIEIMDSMVKFTNAINTVKLEAQEAIQYISQNTEFSADRLMNKEIDQIEKDIAAGIQPGISYGFHDIDKVATKMQPGDLIVFAARPSMGKSLLVLSIAIYVAIVLDKPVDLYSLEMPASRMVDRIISMHTGISTVNITQRTLKPSELAKIKAMRSKMNANLHIYCDAKVTPATVKANAQKRQSALGVIDYLQLMHSDNPQKNALREQEVSSISRALKTCAMDCNMPVIAVSQLSRQVEAPERKKTGHRPMLSDLRESGAIEQDADMVAFIYRPSYYNIKDSSWPENVTEIIIEKNRNSTKDTVPLLFDTENLCFKNYTEAESSDFIDIFEEFDTTKEAEF